MNNAINKPSNEKVIDTVTIEGVTFEVIEKSRTLYAGFRSVAPDTENEPDIGRASGRYDEGKQKIVDAILPDCLCCLSIGYSNPVWEGKHPLEFMFGKETSNPAQPEGIYVFDSAPSKYIRVWASEEAWALTKKITGEDKCPGLVPLYGLIGHIFFTDFYGYKRNNTTGNHAMSYYYDDGRSCVYLPVEAITG